MSLASEAFLLGSQVPMEVAGEGMERQVLGYDGSILMARVTFRKGAVGAIHTHEHAQVTYVESGLFDVFIDGVRKRLGPGDGFYVKPHREHGAVCIEPGVLIDVFSPVREDFLEGRQA